MMQDLTWPQVATLTQHESLCLLPLGATEQHGPHLPLSTDSDIATAICMAASARTRVPVLPTLTISSSHAHTTKWPGTLSYPAHTVTHMLVELAHWVTAAGFSRLLMVNAHLGNAAPIRVALEQIRQGDGIRVGAVSWFELSSAITEIAFADGADIHANAAETSLMLHLRPDVVDLSAVRDDPDRTEGLVFSYTVAHTSLDGLTGSPTQASAAAGEHLFGLIVTALSERVNRARTEEPPLPT